MHEKALLLKAPDDMLQMASSQKHCQTRDQGMPARPG